MLTTFTKTYHFSVSSEELFKAWLDGEKHSEMTGGEAVCSDKEGGEFSAWDGYIFGKNVKITPFSEIVQTWRTTEFQDDDPDSLLTLKFEDTNGKCELTLIHDNIPANQPDYNIGWDEHYFHPMSSYFS